MNHNDKTGERGETHPILVQSIARSIHCVLHRVHCDNVTPETGPIGHDKEDAPAALKLLNKIITDHSVVLT